MAIYEIKGATYEIPDDLPRERVKEILGTLQNRPEAAPTNQQPEDKSYAPTVATSQVQGTQPENPQGAIYEVNGQIYELPSDLQGDELQTTLRTLEAREYKQNKQRYQAILNAGEDPAQESAMASQTTTYEVNGQFYALSNDLQGDQLTDTLKKLQALPPQEQGAQPAVAPAVNPQDNVGRFLDFLGKAEGADYDIIVGGKERISDYSKHPGIVGLTTADGPSTAAGKYQITKTTYDDFAPRLGITDFSPESQDKIAKAIIEQAGVMGAVESGDFATAIGKLGGRWASLPSSKYKQGKRSQEWVDSYFSNSSEVAPQAPTEQPTTPYRPFAKVRQDIDPVSLNNDPDWLAASQAMYRMRNRKDFQGSPEDLASWGKSFMGDFNFNMVQMGIYAHSLNKNGSQEDKQAFLYMMDTYDNTNFSWEGAGRAATAIATDPLTWAGSLLPGVGLAGKIIASTAEKQAVKHLLLQGLGRTGIIAGAEGAIYGGSQDAIKQGVEVGAGRKESRDLLQLGLATGVGAGAGVLLGTAADTAISAITNIARRNIPSRASGGKPTVTPGDSANGVPNVAPQASPVAVPGTPPEVAPGASVVDPNAIPTEVPQVAPSASPTAPAVAPSAVPEGNLLTDAEVAAATARGQKGRLPEDDVMPLPQVDESAAAALQVPDANTGLRSTPMSMDELTGLGGDVAEQLRDLDDANLRTTLEALRWDSRSLEESRIVARGIQLHADELRIKQAELIKQMDLDPDSPDLPALRQQLNVLDERLVPLSLADDAFGSIAGSILRQRQEGLGGLKGVSVDSVMAEKGLTRQEAEVVYGKLVEASRTTVEAQKITRAYDTQIQEALDKGDMGSVSRLTVMKNRELDGLGMGSPKDTASWIEKVNEFAISNVFSPTTVMVNLVPSAIKTAVLPTVRALVTNPLKRETRSQLAASYGAMRSTFGGAIKAAGAAYRYEQSMLTRDANRLLEHTTAIEGRKGGLIRTLPRILNASDEFLAQINYNSYIAGRAASDAAIDGSKNGLVGKSLDDHIDKATKEALENAYAPVTGEELIQPVISKGISLGYSGDELADYVARHAAKSIEALRPGSNEAAMDFSRDVLFKRRFSGSGMRSSLAVSYEKAVNEWPVLKLITGQLFFRTPMRVFEEGIRLTPGLQIIAPNFPKDLAGLNGVERQVRAQGEALMSLGIAGAVMTMYAEGRLTGDGAYENYRQSKLRGDSALPDQYSLKMRDGSTWSYRSFDPIATPIKIMVNGLERLDNLAIRQAQGETIKDSEFKVALSYVSTGTMAAWAAVTDANLVAGLDGSIKFMEALSDPEGKEDAWLKLMGEKLNLLVPNTMRKIAKENDPRISDPADFWQMVELRLDPLKFVKSDIKTSFSYDILGNPRELADTGALWNIFSTASEEERGRGRSPESLLVMQEMDRLAKETGAVFAPPLKAPMTGSMDLRTVLTEDGTETLYDRWNRRYQEMTPEMYLLPILQAPLPEGTFKQKGVKVQEVQGVMGKLREAAFMQVLTEEQKVFDQYMKTLQEQATTKAGMSDYWNFNK